MTARAAIVVAGVLALGTGARAQEGRFDVQLFRPSGAPQDLVMVSQSRPLERWSAAAGLYLSFALDPLKLIRRETGATALSVVGNRFELDAMGAVGLFGWADLMLAVPIVLYQSSDNLAATGAQGGIQATSLSDLRWNLKIAIPGLKRKPEASGFGAALTTGLNMPTGSVDAFTSDDAWTWHAGAVVDYRMKSGILFALNGGMWFRPDRVWKGIRIGNMVPLGAAIEVPVVRSWGIGLLGEVYTHISVDTLPAIPRQVPLNALVGARWYSSSGVTLTIGLGGGCDCSFGAPQFSFFTSLIWVPTKTREYEAIERFKQPPPPDPDPDKDQVIGEKDRCPDKSGPVENHGCPDIDKDKDGIVDRLDKCPAESGGGDPDGCPEFRVVDDKIVLREQIYFYTDSDLIKPESMPLLERLTQFLTARAEINHVRVDGHTDVRASSDYNQRLSERRARAVVKFLVDHGVQTARLQARGYGAAQPLAKLEHPEQCQGVDPEDRKSKNMALPMMTPECIQATAINRRIEFTIEHTYHAVLPEAGLPKAALPSAALPSAGLPSAGLPKAGLPRAGLPKAGNPAAGLPTKYEVSAPPR